MDKIYVFSLESLILPGLTEQQQQSQQFHHQQSGLIIPLAPKFHQGTLSNSVPPPQQRNILFGGDGKCLDLGPFGLCGDDIRPPPPPPHNKIVMNGQNFNFILHSILVSIILINQLTLLFFL